MDGRERSWELLCVGPKAYTKRLSAGSLARRKQRTTRGEWLRFPRHFPHKRNGHKTALGIIFAQLKTFAHTP